MRLRAKLAAATVFVAVVAAPASAITYGVPDGTGHPNVGALIGDFGGDLFQVCSGTLVSPTVFVTASHCTSYLEEQGASALVTFDPASALDGGSTLIPGVMHTNPAWKNLAGLANSPDVVVITFSSSVLGACQCTPARLPTAGLLDELAAKNGLKGQRFTAVGYGLTQRVKNGPGTPQLGDTNLRMVATEDFNALGPTWLHLSQNPSLGNGGTCYGDSGGPNFLGTSDVIAGLTVTGDRWCRSTNVTFRLDTPAAREFLENWVALP